LYYIKTEFLFKKFLILPLIDNVLLVDQELLILREHLGSLPFIVWVRIAEFLVFWVAFYRFVLFHLAIVLSILLRLIAKFKTELRERKDISQVPKHYEIGHWKLNIILTQVRCFASFLNYDLFQVNIVSGPSSRCGANREDSYHFFFDCSHYSNIRHTVHCFKISTGYLIIVF
jgi:hypothetical protein